VFKKRPLLVKVVRETPEGPVEELKLDFSDMKDHFERHKFAYGVGAGVAIAGTVYFVTRGSYAGRFPVPDKVQHIIIRPFSIFSRQNVITVIAREGRGHPGYIVRCKETGEVFLSQAEAAQSVGTSATNMSQHLNGRFSDVYGKHFERLTP